MQLLMGDYETELVLGVQEGLDVICSISHSLIRELTKCSLSNRPRTSMVNRLNKRRRILEKTQEVVYKLSEFSLPTFYSIFANTLHR